MKNRVFLYSARPSAGARQLSRLLGIRKIRTSNSNYRPRETDIIVNWGNTVMPVFEPARVLNTVTAVGTAVNKLSAFKVMSEAGVNVPLFTEDEEKAAEWMGKGYTVIGRQLLRASEGRGILVFEPDGILKKCPLYTLYRKKSREFRVHIFQGEVFDVQEKKRRVSDGRWSGDNCIRNAAGGWVFTRQDVQPPDDVLKEAAKAVGALGLDFGAVDCGYSDRKSRATVYEANTAPALVGSTLSNYRSVFSRVQRRC
jgi:glutathione synthase/RimK-type ligase-like ATP-grasp enzyme